MLKWKTFEFQYKTTVHKSGKMQFIQIFAPDYPMACKLFNKYCRDGIIKNSHKIPEKYGVFIIDPATKAQSVIKPLDD